MLNNYVGHRSRYDIRFLLVHEADISHGLFRHGLLEQGSPRPYWHRYLRHIPYFPRSIRYFHFTYRWSHLCVGNIWKWISKERTIGRKRRSDESVDIQQNKMQFERDREREKKIKMRQRR
eukprot:PhF_6_TR38339/c0_g1_i1/m.57161